MSTKKDDDEGRSLWRKLELTFITIGLLSVAFIGIWIGLSIDGSTHKLPFVENDAIQKLNATSTVEFSLEGIKNKQKLREKLNVTYDKHKLTEDKQEIESELDKVQQRETSLE